MRLLIILFRFLVIGVIVYLLYKVLWKGESPRFFKKKKTSPPAAPLEKMKKDPVCGTYLPESQAIKYRQRKETYYFCSEECKSKFQKLHK